MIPYFPKAEQNSRLRYTVLSVRERPVPNHTEAITVCAKITAV